MKGQYLKVTCQYEMGTRWSHARVRSFFVNVIFENIIIRKPIDSLLLFRASMEISIENIVLNSGYFLHFWDFFLKFL